MVSVLEGCAVLGFEEELIRILPFIGASVVLMSKGGAVSVFESVLQQLPSVDASAVSVSEGGAVSGFEAAIQLISFLCTAV